MVLGLVFEHTDCFLDHLNETNWGQIRNNLPLTVQIRIKNIIYKRVYDFRLAKYSFANFMILLAFRLFLLHKVLGKPDDAAERRNQLVRYRGLSELLSPGLILHKGKLLDTRYVVETDHRAVAKVEH